ncbi:MAG: nucleoside monophosphate kinase, partial [Opitutales bacterium]|nr:nucleoside monophosphate kinase [Opitutales bacterium]
CPCAQHSWCLENTLVSHKKYCSGLMEGFQGWGNKTVAKERKKRHDGAMDQKYRTILLFGAPGTGKGTQGHALGELPGFFHCSCGDVFRSIDTSTELGQAFLQYSSKGQLVPDEITLRLWKARIKHRVNSRDFRPEQDILVLDGIPRDVNQAMLMKDMIEVLKVFHLTCPDRDQLFSRLRSRALRDNRIDDASNTVIEKRLATYDSISKPLMGYYGEDRICHINALQHPAKVMRDLLQEAVPLLD